MSGKSTVPQLWVFHAKIICVKLHFNVIVPYWVIFDNFKMLNFPCSSSSERLFQRDRVHQLLRLPPVLEETGICSVSQVREYKNKTITIAHLSLLHSRLFKNNSSVIEPWLKILELMGLDRKQAKQARLSSICIVLFADILSVCISWTCFSQSTLDES